MMTLIKYNTVSKNISAEGLKLKHWHNKLLTFFGSPKSLHTIICGAQTLMYSEWKMNLTVLIVHGKSNISI